MAKLVVTAIVLIAALVLCAAEERGGPSEKTPSGRAGDHAKEKHLEIYKRLFALKRREHIETAEKVLSINDYAQQFKTVSFVMEAIFPVLSESMQKIVEADYVPSAPFPEELEMQEVLGKVYENVIFFGDFLLRLPDMTKKIYKKHKEWHSTLEWAVSFCNESKGVFAGPHATQLHLMAQEIGLVPEDPNYFNPFRAPAQKEEDSEDIHHVKKRAAKKEKQNKGPKLRGTKHYEL